MIQEPFANWNSLIHRLDLRIKVVFATIYSFIVALSMRFPTLLGALFISFLLLGLARLNVVNVAKRVVVVNGFTLLFWLLLPLTFEGDPLFHLGPLTFTHQGIVLAAQITLKSNAILLTFISLIASMPISTLGHSLDRLLIPEKIVHLFLITYRYVFVIEQEHQRLVRAAKIRGFRPGTNIHTYKTYAYFIGMLFVRAAKRAERVRQAMLCRGFKGKIYCLSKFSLSRLDLVWSTFMSTVIIGLVVIELTFRT